MFLLPLFLCSICGAAASAAATSRELYIDYTDLARVEVSTSYSGINFAYGVASGEYEGNSGLFVSAFKPPAVYFMDTSNGCEDDQSCNLVQLVGSGVAGITNGAFTGLSGTTASISDPSRMAFSASLGVVFVMDRTNGLIRYLNLASKTVGTLNSGGQPIQIYGSKLPDNNPELDVKISGEYLYVSDSSWVYNITGADGTLAGALSDAVISPYHALKAWQIDNDYERTNKIYLTSIAINAAAGVMYVSYSYRRQAIVIVPLGVGSADEISILVSDNVRWNPVQTVPVSVNGYIDAPTALGQAYVTFPMHMQYDAETNAIFFVEVFAHFSSGTLLGALGSVAVRRLQLDTRMVDYIAGFDDTFRPIYGKETGYVDGWAENAEFSYPVTLDFVGASVSGNGGLRAYVVDSQNSAIRKLEAVTDTPHPSVSPTISMEPTRPTLTPTSAQPTIAPTGQPATPVPTAVPTVAPSISLSPTVYSPPTGQPTELNGECFTVVLSDTFGDGWSGATLRVDTPGHEEEQQFFAPMSSDPSTFRVCSSYLRPEQFGLYPMLIVAPKGTETLWEIRWTVTIESSGETYSGDSESLFVFRFDDNGFVFVDSSNEFVTADSFSCHRCPHPKPKPKPKPSTSEDEDSAYSMMYEMDYDMQELMVTQEEYRQLLPGSKPPPPDPRPPAKLFELPFVLHDNSGNGWSDHTGEGSSYFILDDKRGRVISEGTLCGENLLKDDCAVNLADGDYYFRVTGDGSTSDEEVFWTFCKQRGFARQELSFTMIDGVCFPGVLRDAEVILSSPLSTKISVSGHLLVENVFGPILSSIDILAIESGIQKYLFAENTTTFDVMVTSTCNSENGNFCADSGDDDASDDGSIRRKLSAKSKPKPKPIPDGTSTWDVSFLVTLVTEENDVDGTQYSKVVELSKRVGRELTRGVHSGDLQGRIHDAGADSSSIAWVHVRREKPARLVHINYVSTAPPSITPFANDEASKEEKLNADLLAAPNVVTVSVDNSGMEFLMLFAIIGVPLLVLAAFAGYKRKYGSSADVVLGVSVPVQKGGWESVVFSGTVDSPGHSSHSASPRGLDSEVVAGRNHLPYPDNSSSKHSSTTSYRKEGSITSALSVDALLEIPGRAGASRSVGAPLRPAVDAPNSDSRADFSSRGSSNNASITSVSRQALVTSNSSRFTPEAVGSQRDRFRVREGLDHHDLSLSSIRSGLTEDKIVL